KSVPGQDFAVQDDQGGPRMDRGLEHLVSSDAAIIQVRRRLLRALRELREGQEPPEAHDGARYAVRSLDMVLPKDVAIEEGGRAYMTAKV
ncbi:MAG: aromatic ring-hydroxylating dioxygenase subunit alpha, partial [Chloroflexi bacterium]|nr:aromatic ring-hydroxylating dioxygenase subunit alpha [Chloroflexota bacterium]